MDTCSIYNKRPEKVSICIKIGTSKRQDIIEFDIYLDEIETLLDMKEKYCSINKNGKLYALEIKKDLKEICRKYFTEYMI